MAFLRGVLAWDLPHLTQSLGAPPEASPAVAFREGESLNPWTLRPSSLVTTEA